MGMSVIVQVTCADGAMGARPGRCQRCEIVPRCVRPLGACEPRTMARRFGEAHRSELGEHVACVDLQGCGDGGP